MPFCGKGDVGACVDSDEMKQGDWTAGGAGMLWGVGGRVVLSGW